MKMKLNQTKPKSISGRALLVGTVVGTLALLPLEVRCDAGVRFLHGFITEDSTAPCGCLSDSSLFLSATWMGLEVAGLHAGRSPGVCVFHLHSEGGALLLGALEIALFIQGVTWGLRRGNFTVISQSNSVLNTR